MSVMAIAVKTEKICLGSKHSEKVKALKWFNWLNLLPVTLKYACLSLDIRALQDASSLMLHQSSVEARGAVV